MTNPLISIVVPVYNAERYLNRCLRSIEYQKYRPLQIVLVDDGSTDGSSQICEDFARNQTSMTKDVQVVVLHQSNSGASIARKNGIKATTGEFISFIDADDFVSSDYISALYEAILDHNTSISVCPFMVGKFGGNFDFPQEMMSHLLSKKELFDRFFKYEFWGFWGGVYKKELFNMVTFPKATINEDYLVKAQLFSHHTKVAEVRVPLYYYEKHEGSLSSLRVSERALGEFDNAYETWKYVQTVLPEYSNQALAIVSEAACKWLGRIASDESKQDCKISLYNDLIRQFIRNNFISIFRNPNLLWKIKIMMLINYFK